MQAVTGDVDLEDFNVKSIVIHSFEQGHLRLLAELETGEFLPIPFHQVKKDHPTMVAQCVIENDVGRTQKKWAQNILKQRLRALRRLHFMHGVDKAFHIKIRRKIKKDHLSKSKNSRNAKMKLRKKFGIRIPNNVRETLILDKINNDAKWQDAIEK